MLYGPGGASPLQIGSWLRGDQPWDFGTKDLIQPQYAQTPLVDGGVLGYEFSGVRHMAFPLLVASGASGMSLQMIESLLRLNARPGAYVDFQPFAVPSAEAVRFDILSGRWEPDYDVHHEPIQRRAGMLYLDTQPFGYWPTWITLASVGNSLVGSSMFGMIDLGSGSIIGDSPGLVRFAVAEESPPQPLAWPYNAASPGIGVFDMDFLAWSLAGNASHYGMYFASGGFFNLQRQDSQQPAVFYTEASLPPIATGVVYYTPGQATWTQAFTHLASPGLLGGIMPGRHRWFAAARINASTLPVQVAMDVGNAAFGIQNFNAMQAVVATLNPPLASGGATAGAWFQGSQAYQLLDLGEFTVGTVSDNSSTFRVFFQTASPNLGGTVGIQFAAMFALPLDGPAGVIPRGICYPSAGIAPPLYSGAVHFDADLRRVDIQNTGNRADAIPTALAESLQQHYRGGMPYCGASTTKLMVLPGGRFHGNSTLSGLPSQPPFLIPSGLNGFGNPAFGYAIQYRPRFQFLKGI